VLPGQLGILSYFIIQVCQFNFVPLEAFVDGLDFGENDMMPYNNYFDQMGYSYKNILLNIGSIIVIMGVFAFTTIVVIPISKVHVEKKMYIFLLNTFLDWSL